jgi:hypothetical protein
LQGRDSVGKGRPIGACTLLATLFICLLIPLDARAEQRTTQLVTTGPGTGLGFRGVSDDGSRAFFITEEQLVSEDTDAGCGDIEFGEPPRPCADVYEWVNGVPTLLSTGGNGPFDASLPFCPTCPNGLSASRDGSHVFFETAERLVSEDTDDETDVYEHSGGITRLVSTGPAGGNGAYDAYFSGMSADGTRVFFGTGERLTGDDTDAGCADTYERVNGVTTLVSTGPTDGLSPSYRCGAGFAGASDDGSRVFFTTFERFVSEDTDGIQNLYGNEDLYERFGNTTRLVSTGPAGGNGQNLAYGARFVGASADGTHVFFQTWEPLVSADTDSCGPDYGCNDIYERSGGETRLVSTGPADDNGNFFVRYIGASADGTHVFFNTSNRLVSEDTDTRLDEYERVGGTTTRLVTTGPAGGNGPFDGNFNFDSFAVSEDGERAFFATNERLVSEDTDSNYDVYERVGGTTTRLVSTGPLGGNGDFNSVFRSITPDGSRVFFYTYETLTMDDRDGGAPDIYERAGNDTTLISTGPAGGSGHFFVGFFVPTSRDGSRVFFYTAEPLVSADTDTLPDIYVSIVNHPPDCSSVAPDRAVLAPANHHFDLVSLGGVKDPDGDPVTLKITSVTQDEPLRSAGDNTAPDAIHGTDAARVYLRAERSARGDGRVYRIAFTASDGNGGSCTGTASVAVARKKKSAAHDSSPPSYDSLGS